MSTVGRNAAGIVRPVRAIIDTMQNAAFDPGLTNQYAGALRRAINRDGTFNIRRRGVSWRDSHPYLHLINMSWPGFLATALASYLVVNTIFACIYWLAGPEQLHGAEAPSPLLLPRSAAIVGGAAYLWLRRRKDGRSL